MSSLDDIAMTAFRITTPKELGLAVRDRRRALGLDQLTLARAVGVSRQWVSELEHGKPRAEVALVLRTLRALDVEVWLGNEPPKTAKRGRGSASVDIDAIVDGTRKSR
jgi:HTH-type transcriptional regulator/antitoxin HipB